ncbi:MAG: flagellar biosynthetic protein FliR [Firmicutes bacterium]|nr:flagellar biosynthetic protein FliR [Bacillota bacterium]
MSEILWYNFLFIVARIASFFVTLPITSYRGVPNIVKVFFALVFSYLIFLSRDFSYLSVNSYTSIRLFLLLGGEIITGLVLGFVVLLFFSVFRMAGQFADVKIGLSMASIFDPQFAGSVTLIGQFYYLLTIIIYFALNGHHHLFLAINQSFEIMPIGGSALTDITIRLVFDSFYYIWLMAFQIAAPVVAAILITDISLGLISKTVPQLQVFMVGLPLKFFIGLLVLYLTLPYLALMMEGVFDRLYVDLLRIMESMV